MVQPSCVPRGERGPTDRAEQCPDSPSEREITMYRAHLAKSGVTLIRCGYPKPRTRNCVARAAICQGSVGNQVNTYICNGGFTCQLDPSALRPLSERQPLTHLATSSSRSHRPVASHGASWPVAASGAQPCTVPRKRQPRGVGQLRQLRPNSASHRSAATHVDMAHTVQWPASCREWCPAVHRAT